MSWRIFWAAAAVVAVMLTIGVWTAMTATFLFRHPGNPDVRVVIDRRTGAPVVAALADPASGIKLTKPEPRAGVNEKEFDFGLMDPGISGKHDFLIQNVGDDVLELKLGGTTCKCTISGVSDSRVPPGKTATMTMEWNTGRYDPQFAQSALIRTNDPLHKEIEFTVKGQIRALVTAQPKEVTLPMTQPGERAQGDLLIYSQMWPDFEIVDASSQLRGLKWTVEPIIDAAAELSAASAKRVKFEFDNPVAHGAFQEQIRFDIKPQGEPDSVHHQYVAIHGQALRRMAIYGPAIDGNGVVELGNVAEGKGKRVKLLAKVRDPETEISDAEVETFPAFLRAQFSQHEGGQKGLYDITIELPDDQTPCQYNSSPVGRVKIETHHPRIGAVELLVTFAIVPRRSL